MTPNRERSEPLQRGLGFIHVFCIAVGAMISSGIFILPGLAFVKAGPSVIASYCLAGMLALVGIFSVAELATAMPKAGGDYYFITRSLGPLVGTVSGVLSWFALSLKTAFAVFGLSELVHLITGWPIVLIAAPICLGFTVVNVIGVKEAARLEVVLVLALLGLMLLYVLRGTGAMEPARFTPLTPHGVNAMLITAGFVFVSFGGLLNVATMAEEVRNPTRTIPMAFVSSVILITILYTAVMTVTVGVMPEEHLARSMTPLADAARYLAGRGGYVVVSIAAVLAFVTTANAGIMSASRYPLALSRDGLMPAWFGMVSRRFETPVTAVISTGLVVFLSLLLPLELLVKAASTVVLTTYVLSSLAVIILRHSGVQNYRPTFRVPGYPWVPGIGIVLFCLLIVDMGLATIEISLGLVIVGLLLYMCYGRRTEKREYALLHLVHRIRAKELAGDTLESELKAVIRERDQVVLDRFDQVVQNAKIVDLTEGCGRDAIFKRVASELQTDARLSAEQIHRLLEERELQSSTALSDFVAVPHLIVPGEEAFCLMAIRCSAGVAWSEEAPGIKAIFVICGTKDCRNLHLKALAAIAHIVQHPDFEAQWLGVNRTEHLRDILLMSERKRASA